MFDGGATRRWSGEFGEISNCGERRGHGANEKQLCLKSSQDLKKLHSVACYWLEMVLSGNTWAID